MCYRVQEDDIGAYINVGRTYNSLQMYPEAEEAYMKVRHVRRPASEVVGSGCFSQPHQSFHVKLISVTSCELLRQEFRPSVLCEKSSSVPIMR